MSFTSLITKRSYALLKCILLLVLDNTTIDHEALVYMTVIQKGPSEIQMKVDC